MENYYIYSDEHKAFWREKAQGYTESIAEAGVYSYEEAHRLTNHCGPEKQIRIGRFVPGPTVDLETLRQWEAAKAFPPHGWFVYASSTPAA